MREVARRGVVSCGRGRPSRAFGQSPVGCVEVVGVVGRDVEGHPAPVQARRARGVASTLSTGPRSAAGLKCTTALLPAPVETAGAAAGGAGSAAAMVLTCAGLSGGSAMTSGSTPPVAVTDAGSRSRTGLAVRCSRRPTRPMAACGCHSVGDGEREGATEGAAAAAGATPGADAGATIRSGIETR
jgi:hypothetical protein